MSTIGLSGHGKLDSLGAVGRHPGQRDSLGLLQQLRQPALSTGWSSTTSTPIMAPTAKDHHRAASNGGVDLEPAVALLHEILEQPQAQARTVGSTGGGGIETAPVVVHGEHHRAVPAAQRDRHL